MLLRRNDDLIRFPEVAVAMTMTISGGDALPQFLTAGLASVADHISDDLTGGTA